MEGTVIWWEIQSYGAYGCWWKELNVSVREEEQYESGEVRG